MSNRVFEVDADLVAELIEIIVAEHTHVALAGVYLRKLAGSGMLTPAHRATDALVDVIACKETYDRGQITDLIARTRLEIGKRVILDYGAVIEPAIGHVRTSLKTSPETRRRRHELQAPSEAIPALIEQGLRGIGKPFGTPEWEASAKALVLAIETLDELHWKIDEFRRRDSDNQRRNHESKKSSWGIGIGLVALLATLVFGMLSYISWSP